MMPIFVWTIIALALAGIPSVFAGTCDCRPEVQNVSAEVTNSCSKVWSNNHCTLKESGSLSSRVREKFHDNLDAGILRLEQILVQLDENVSSEMFDAQAYANQFQSGDYAFEAHDSCIRRVEVDVRDLVMVLIDSTLTFGTSRDIVFLVAPERLGAVIDIVIQEDVAQTICRSDRIENRAFTEGTLFFGAGCLAYGDSRSNVVTNVGGWNDCNGEIRF